MPLPALAAGGIYAALTAALGWLVRSQIGFWIASALAAFGLHIVAQKFAVEPAISALQSEMAGLGADGLAWFAYLKVDQVITILLSAYAAAAGMSAVRIRQRPVA